MKYEHKWDYEIAQGKKVKRFTVLEKTALSTIRDSWATESLISWKVGWRFTSFLWLFNIHELSWTPTELVGRGCHGELYKARHLTLVI